MKRKRSPFSLLYFQEFFGSNLSVIMKDGEKCSSQIKNLIEFNVLKE
jgi:hypothetical protein